jgi:D-cysteine desulfhydrase
VVGASVSRPVETARDEIAALAARCASLLGVAAGHPFELVDARGPGFGVASEAGERAAAVALRAEGLLLDPVYTAKAFAVVLDLVAQGAAGPIVFWHTGGLLSATDHLACP